MIDRNQRHALDEALKWTDIRGLNNNEILSRSFPGKKHSREIASFLGSIVSDATTLASRVSPRACFLTDTNLRTSPRPTNAKWSLVKYHTLADLEREVSKHGGRLRTRTPRTPQDPLYGLCIFEAFVELLHAAGHEQPEMEGYAPFIMALPGTAALHLGNHANSIIGRNSGVFETCSPPSRRPEPKVAATALIQALVCPTLPVSHSIAVLAVLTDLYDVSIDVVRSVSGHTQWFTVPTVSARNATAYVGTLLITDTLHHGGVLHAFSMETHGLPVTFIHDRPQPRIDMSSMAFRGSARAADDQGVSVIAKTQIALSRSKVLLAIPGEKAVVIYTDGAVPNNGRGGTKGGIGIHCATKHFPDISRSYNGPTVTNNTMEVLAIIEALGAYGRIPFVKGMKVHLRTDSAYGLCLLHGDLYLLEQRGWRTSAGIEPPNLSLLKQLAAALKCQHGDTYIGDQLVAEKVKAHSGVVGNVIADRLAATAAAIAVS
jgi:ribonuclease HI